jgi:hypothetical protein
MSSLELGAPSYVRQSQELISAKEDLPCIPGPGEFLAFSTPITSGIMLLSALCHIGGSATREQAHRST